MAIKSTVPRSDRDLVAGELETAIEESKWVLSLQAGWDGPDAQAIRFDTWTRAADCVRCLGRSGLSEFAEVLPAPRIGPVADGSIDLFWNDDSENLLINIPPDATMAATFDGVRPDGNSIRGSLVNLADLAHLTAWLMQR